MLTAKLIEECMSKKQLVVFSVGLVSATLFFLTLIAFLGIVLAEFIPTEVSNILNIIVGAFIVFFGIRMLFKKEKAGQDSLVSLE